VPSPSRATQAVENRYNQEGTRARICTNLRSPGIDPKPDGRYDNPICTVVPARQAT
jgi:hypothetical protein